MNNFLLPPNGRLKDKRKCYYVCGQDSYKTCLSGSMSMYLAITCTHYELTGGVFMVNSFVNLSVNPGSSELPPTAIIPLYKLCKNTTFTSIRNGVLNC